MFKRNYNLLMRSLDLPQFSTIDELSGIMGLSGSLIYCLSQRTENYYKKTYIEKKNGGKREIYIPSPSLKIVQKWILNNILEKIKPSNQAMAYRKGNIYGCKSNASIHMEMRYGLAIDLKNFFPSITSNRVYTVFSNVGYGKFAATLLTNLCTLDNFLPQGSPCSPTLSNLVCMSLDARLIGLCEKRRIRYSRYADDMYFSCDNQDVLKKTVPIIKKIITYEGFAINKDKVHYHTPSNKKCITGITVSKDALRDTSQLKARKSLKRKIRSEIYYALISGDYTKKEHIIGEIMYVNSIECDYAERIKKYIKDITTKILIFPELVEKYNENLFFKSLDKIMNKSLEEFEKEFGDECEYCFYMEDLVFERKKFIQKNKLNDICKYERWPLDRGSMDENPDLPF